MQGLHQKLNTYIAMGAVFAVGIGAVYLIIDFANNTNFSYVSTDDSIIISAEFER